MLYVDISKDEYFERTIYYHFGIMINNGNFFCHQVHIDLSFTFHVHVVIERKMSKLHVQHYTLNYSVVT